MGSVVVLIWLSIIKRHTKKEGGVGRVEGGGWHVRLLSICSSMVNKPLEL